MREREFAKHLVKRLARIGASDVWGADLNPAQRAAMEYLGRANRFSRKPSQVAEFFGSTRGTVSQTLKSLARKGYVIEVRSETDKRSISYELTPVGVRLLEEDDILDESLKWVSSDDVSRIVKDLRRVLENALSVSGQKPFGLCKDCIYFKAKQNGGCCQLLKVPLRPEETTQICHEQTGAK